MKRRFLKCMLLLAICSAFLMSACSKQTEESVQTISNAALQGKYSGETAIAVSVGSGRYRTNYFRLTGWPLYRQLQRMKARHIYGDAISKMR